MRPTNAASIRSERASIVLLFPAAFLIVLLLASIALDFGAVELRQRELNNAAAAAANDAVTYGVAIESLRAGRDEIVLDPMLVERAIADSLARRGATDVEILGFCLDSSDQRGVKVALARRTNYVLARVVPGAGSGRDLVAVERASLESDRFPSSLAQCDIPGLALHSEAR
ncbi:MAG: hypothetical protein HKN26_03805 [Acidimicrobiales bacterium]|nr:hypothetical protein [Acidimicrobiales bacterium]